MKHSRLGFGEIAILVIIGILLFLFLQWSSSGPDADKPVGYTKNMELCTKICTSHQGTVEELQKQGVYADYICLCNEKEGINSYPISA